MSITSQSVVIFKNTFDVFRLQMPVVRRQDGNVAALIYGNNLDVYDANGFVITLVSKVIGQDAIFVLFYDKNLILLNRDGEMQIPGDFREIAIKGDSDLYLSAIVENTNTFPIPFYNMNGDIDIQLSNIYDQHEFVFIANFGSNIQSVLDQGDIQNQFSWRWLRSINVEPIPAVIAPSPLYAISSTTLNFVSDAIIISVCAIGNLSLFFGDVRITSPVLGSSFMSYAFSRTSGILISARGIFTPQSITDVLDNSLKTSFYTSSRSFFGNLLSGAAVVENTNGLFFQSVGINQGVSLPNGYASTIMYLVNPFSTEAIYSFYFVGFRLIPDVNYIQEDFQVSINFRTNIDLYMTILCNRTAPLPLDVPYQIATTGGLITSIKPSDLGMSPGECGYAMFRFKVNVSDSRDLLLTNVYSFNGPPTASVSLNKIGVVSSSPSEKEVIASLILETNEISSINVFNVEYAGPTNLVLNPPNVIQLKTNKNEVIWLNYAGDNIVNTYNAFVADTLIGQATEQDNIDSTVVAVYSENTTTDTVQVTSSSLDFDLFEYAVPTPGVYALILLNVEKPQSPWKGWSIALFVLGCLMVVITVAMILSNIYDNIKAEYGIKYPIL